MRAVLMIFLPSGSWPSHGLPRTLRSISDALLMTASRDVVSSASAAAGTVTTTARRNRQGDRKHADDSVPPNDQDVLAGRSSSRKRIESLAVARRCRLDRGDPRPSGDDWIAVAGRHRLRRGGVHHVRSGLHDDHRHGRSMVLTTPSGPQRFAEVPRMTTAQL